MSLTVRTVIAGLHAKCASANNASIDTAAPDSTSESGWHGWKGSVISEHGGRLITVGAADVGTVGAFVGSVGSAGTTPFNLTTRWFSGCGTRLLNSSPCCV